MAEESETFWCESCDEGRPSDASFCQKCGAKVTVRTPEPEPSPEPEEPALPAKEVVSPAPPERLPKKQLLIAASLVAALVLAGGTYGVIFSIQQQREEQLAAEAVEEPEVAEVTQEEESVRTIKPEGPPPPPQDWFCLEPGVFGILATCETKVDNDENGLYWDLQLVCFDDGTTTQWVDANTNSASRGSPAVDLVPWANASAVKIRIDGSVQEWPISVDNDATSFTFRTASTASQSAWDFLSAIAPAQTLGIEVADASGLNRNVDFPVSGSTTVAALFSANGCSSSGPR